MNRLPRSSAKTKPENGEDMTTLSQLMTEVIRAWRLTAGGVALRVSLARQ
jgi:hypothetical protein